MGDISMTTYLTTSFSYLLLVVDNEHTVWLLSH